MPKSNFDSAAINIKLLKFQKNWINHLIYYCFMSNQQIPNKTLSVILVYLKKKHARDRLKLKSWEKTVQVFWASMIPIILPIHWYFRFIQAFSILWVVHSLKSSLTAHFSLWKVVFGSTLLYDPSSRVHLNGIENLRYVKEMK